MSDARPSTQERLLSAFHSSDLSLETDKRKDADHLIALGVAGQRRGRVSSDLMRLTMAGSRSDYRAARESVVALTLRLGGQRGWRISVDNMRKIGEIALAHYTFPVCPHCYGRGRDTPEGSPYLSGNICKPCNGSGKRPVQKKFNGEIRDVIEMLGQITTVTERAVSRLLR